MDPIVVVLATAVGALIGISVGILLLRRKLRPPVTDTEFAALKGKLQTAESSFAAASANIEDLRKQIALQERTLLQNGEDLKKRQEQLDIESAETQEEKARRFAAEQSVQEVSAKVILLTEQCTKLEARVKEESNLVAEKTTRLVSVAAELEGEKRKIQELTELATHLASESAELKRSGEQEARFRAALEAQLRTDQERTRQLTSQIKELQSERLQLETKLQEERGSAARGMELLLTVQEKLSSAFKALGADGQNGHLSEAPVGAAAVNPDAKSEAEVVAQPASSSS